MRLWTHLTFHRDLLDAMGVGSVSKICREIENCEQIARAVGNLAQEVAKAGGGNGEGLSGVAKERFYFAIDQPFRRWLSGLDPEGDVEEAVSEWREQAKRSPGKWDRPLWRRQAQQLWLDVGRL